MEEYKNAPVDYYWLQEMGITEHGISTFALNLEQADDGDGVQLAYDGYTPHPLYNDMEVPILQLYGHRGDEPAIIRGVAHGVDPSDAANMMQLDNLDTKYSDKYNSLRGDISTLQGWQSIINDWKNGIEEFTQSDIKNCFDNNF